MKAYFLIETAASRCRDISVALQAYGWVEYVGRGFGTYDVVGVARGDGSREIEELLRKGVAPIDRIVQLVLCPMSTGTGNVTPVKTRLNRALLPNQPLREGDQS